MCEDGKLLIPHFISELGCWNFVVYPWSTVFWACENYVFDVNVIITGIANELRFDID